MQKSTHADSERDRQESDRFEVDELDPAQVAKEQQTQWLAREIEALSCDTLDE
jgi:hypothetical protein